MAVCPGEKLREERGLRCRTGREGAGEEGRASRWSGEQRQKPHGENSALRAGRPTAPQEQASPRPLGAVRTSTTLGLRVFLHDRVVWASASLPPSPLIRTAQSKRGFPEGTHGAGSAEEGKSATLTWVSGPGSAFWV